MIDSHITSCYKETGYAQRYESHSTLLVNLVTMLYSFDVVSFEIVVRTGVLGKAEARCSLIRASWTIEPKTGEEKV